MVDAFYVNNPVADGFDYSYLLTLSLKVKVLNDSPQKVRYTLGACRYLRALCGVQLVLKLV